MTSQYTIGIVGGTGIMGRFFHGVFARHALPSFIWGRKSTQSLAEFCADKDIIMVSVPIDQTEYIIDEIAKIATPGQCICDVTSIKVSPMRAMKRSGMRYFGMHPMFAPPLSGKMEGQNVIFCSGNAEKEESFMRAIFEAESAFLLDLLPEEHDALMSLVQGLSHFLDITFVQTLRQKNIPLEKIFASRSPAYALKMMLAGRTLYQDANLYGNIQIQNPENIETITEFFVQAQQLFSSIVSRDIDAFSQIFTQQKEFLGEYAQRSQEESDIVIDFLAHRILKKSNPVSLMSSHPHATIGILGPYNTFSHIAAQQFFGKREPLRLYPSIAGVFSALRHGEITQVFVPIENMLHGSVAESVDGISTVDIPIRAMYEMQIVPSLFALESTPKEEVGEIFSHPQSLAQCSDFLEAQYPNVHITPVSSTAAAMLRMRETPKSAAIAPDRQMDMSGVQMLFSAIANQTDNATRFAYLSHDAYPHTSLETQGAITFSFPKDAPGNLEMVLHLFSQRSINLTKIESRPTGKGFGEYTFFVTYQGTIPEEERDEFFREFSRITHQVRFLGEFGIFRNGDAGTILSE